MPGPSVSLKLASLGARVGALVIDWGAAMLVAFALFGTNALRGQGWWQWVIMAVFVAEKVVLTGLLGGSFGQLIARLRVFHVSGRRLLWPAVLLRTMLVCLVIPALVRGPDGRSMHDVLAGSVVSKI